MNPSTRKPFAKRSLGQNFLVDQNYIRKIIAAVDPKPEYTIVEIGPGRGALTAELVRSGARVIAIELDRELVHVLSQQFRQHPNFEVVETDALAVDFEALLESHRPISENGLPKLVANLPYYISTAILQRLAEQRETFSEFILMFQKEVVDRITSNAGTSERGYLTVIVENSFVVRRLFDVPPSAFKPRPKIWSSVVKLVPRPKNELDEPEFRALLSSAFSKKRKTIANNLKSKFPRSIDGLREAAIDPQRRAESLSVKEWKSLFIALKTLDN